MFGHKSGADLSTQSALIQPIEDVRHAMTGDTRAGAIVEYVVELVGFPGTKYDDQVRRRPPGPGDRPARRQQAGAGDRTSAARRRCDHHRFD